MKVLVIDVDYIFSPSDNSPVIRIFGKNLENDESIVIHVKGFEPYIVISNPSEQMNIFQFQKFVELKFKSYVKRVEIIQRFLPIGYQINKSNFLRLVLYSPKVVRDLRELLKENITDLTDNNFFESDIKFNNRFMVDNEVDGMSIIEFNEKGHELNNYGLNCLKLYIVDKTEIRVLKDEIVNIEY